MTEITTFIAILKSLGIDSGRIIEGLFILITALITMLLLSKKYVWPLLKQFVVGFNEMKLSVTELNKTLQEHIVQTDLRIQAGEAQFADIKKEIERLKDHCGLK